MSNNENENYNIVDNSFYKEYINFADNKLHSEIETINKQTAIEEDHKLNINEINIEHPIVDEMNNIFDQDQNLSDENDDKKEIMVYGEEEYEKFEEERKENIEIIFSDYLDH